MMKHDDDGTPRIVVLSQLYPRKGQEGAGLFVRERMVRVAQHLPLIVVSPVAWFPLQGLIRIFRPHFRPPAPRHEQRDGIDVYCPRWLSVPGVFKSLDGWLLALCVYPGLRRLKRTCPFDILDAHFGYPDGYAAVLLGRWLGVRVTVTLRGNEAHRIETLKGRKQTEKVVQNADRVFTVSQSLKNVALKAGADAESVQVIPNGVDTEKFRPIDQSRARRQLDLPPDSIVLISVGTLVERKGFHRIIELLPQLRCRFPRLIYLIAGGAGPEGDRGDWLRRLALEHGVDDAVRFLGPVRPHELRIPLSAADLFVLATRREGWANVFLEAMACGLPVITTNVGGNKEVVCHHDIGTVVPFDDSAALLAAIEDALSNRHWDRNAIRDHALKNRWDERIYQLVSHFKSMMHEPSRTLLYEDRAR